MDKDRLRTTRTTDDKQKNRSKCGLLSVVRRPFPIVYGPSSITPSPSLRQPNPKHGALSFFSFGPYKTTMVFGHFAGNG